MDIEKMLSSEIKNDRLPFEMDPAAEQRLMHAANLYSSKHVVRKNSIFEPLIALFTFSMAGTRMAFIALVIMFSLSTGKLIFNSQGPLHCDSTSVSTVSTDTLNHFQGVAVDSVVN